MPLLKRKPVQKRRSVNYCIRFTPDEMKLIETYLIKKGQKIGSKSVFLRQTILSSVDAVKSGLNGL